LSCIQHHTLFYKLIFHNCKTQNLESPLEVTMKAPLRSCEEPRCDTSAQSTPTLPDDSYNLFRTAYVVVWLYSSSDTEKRNGRTHSVFVYTVTTATPTQTHVKILHIYRLMELVRQLIYQDRTQRIQIIELLIQNI